MNEKVTEKNNILTIGELAEVSGTRLTTLKYYTELGILPFNQDGKRLTRKYTEEEALERLAKIKELKKKRLTIKEIIDCVTGQKAKTTPE
jgi:DNA-binding transcriptional MerR regulator